MTQIFVEHVVAAPAFGVLRPGLKPDGSKCDSFRDAKASLPLLKQGAPTGDDLGEVRDAGEIAQHGGNQGQAVPA